MLPALQEVMSVEMCSPLVALCSSSLEPASRHSHSASGLMKSLKRQRCVWIRVCVCVSVCVVLKWVELEVFDLYLCDLSQ